MKARIKRPSPALVVAITALFVALGGTAGAVVTAAVPLAKRALVADNAKKLGGLTPAQYGAVVLRASQEVPGPASTAVGLVTYKTNASSLGANAAGEFTVACDSGQKVIGGGFSSDGPVYNFDSYPRDQGTWYFYLANADETAGHGVSLYAVCLK